MICCRGDPAAYLLNHDIEGYKNSQYHEDNHKNSWNPGAKETKDQGKRHSRSNKEEWKSISKRKRRRCSLFLFLPRDSVQKISHEKKTHRYQKDAQ